MTVPISHIQMRAGCQRLANGGLAGELIHISHIQMIGGENRLIGGYGYGKKKAPHIHEGPSLMSNSGSGYGFTRSEKLAKESGVSP